MPQHRRHQKVLGHCLQQQHQAQQLLTQVHFPHQDPVQRPHIRSAHAQTDIIHHNGTCQCKLHMWHCYRPSVCADSSSYCLKLQRGTSRQPEHMVPGGKSVTPQQQCSTNSTWIHINSLHIESCTPAATSASQLGRVSLQRSRAGPSAAACAEPGPCLTVHGGQCSNPEERLSCPR